MGDTRDEQKSPIQVIERMMRLLKVLERHSEPLSLKQIAQYAALHPSTTHRILSAMAADRLVERVEPGTYRLGMRLLELGNAMKSRINVRQIALPFMKELSVRTGETANLSVRDGEEIVYVERTFPRGSVTRVAHVIGTRAPLRSTASGKLFLLGLGLATDNEETQPGVRCVAAGIRDDAGNLVAALSLSSPADRMQPHWGILVRETAERISLAIGYRPAPRLGVA